MYKNNKKILLRYVLTPIILFILLYLIYLQINAKGDIAEQWQQLKGHLNRSSIKWFISVIILAFVNWSLEAKKWQLLLKRIRPINYRSAFKSMLSGMSISIITPNRSGDFLGRIVHIPKGYKLKAAISSMIGSIAQMCVTATLGFIGLIYYHHHFGNLNTKIGLIAGLIIVPTAIFLFLNIQNLKPFKKKNKWIKRLNFGIYVLRNYNSKDLFQILSISLARALIYNCQFLILLFIFGVELAIIPGLLISFLMFWVIAMIPSVALTELGVRGYVGVAFFVGSGIIDTGLSVLSASYALWLINLALPAIIGSFTFLRISKSSI
ncbi:MAG TPA: lysylphosphatidylglycerol synthase domain-containing protein [Edaphocola sp.]|nr:lysylphosphatidylglycerol synthase domain-containing protein [Edaphocola sp.]